MGINNKVTVVLVDDSSVIRGVLSRMIEKDPNIEIVGSVADGAMGVTMAQTKKPDIMLLDVEMPVMDGLTAIPKVLAASPDTKVIMCSSLTAKGADTSIKAMSLGAVECLVKPTSQESGPGSAFEKKLISLIKSLGAANANKAASTATPRPGIATPPPAAAPQLKAATGITPRPEILAIGSSTGGPQALFEVLKSLGPTVRTPIVITQHMPATFTKILAEHIGQNTQLTAFEGEEGMIVENGKVYVAPGGKHMLFERSGGQLKIKLNDGPQENFCKPAVDPMLRSLVEIYGNKILCVILTGMGKDGLLGAQALSEKGGRIIAQDEATSVVWGMPGAVANAGICSEILPLQSIGDSIKKAL